MCFHAQLDKSVLSILAKVLSDTSVVCVLGLLDMVYEGGTSF